MEEKRSNGKRLAEIGEIRLERIDNYQDARYVVWKEMIEKEHYIGHGHLYGLQIKYLIAPRAHISHDQVLIHKGAAVADVQVAVHRRSADEHLYFLACLREGLLLPGEGVVNLDHMASIGAIVSWPSLRSVALLFVEVG